MAQSRLIEDFPKETMFDDLSNKTPSFRWLQWLVSLIDLLNRIRQNRVTASTNATAVALNGTIQSTGVGTGQILPKRYAETWINARVTFNISAGGSLYVYVVRTTGVIPANGAALGVGDVVVAGDSFAGPATAAGVNVNGSLSWIDNPLSVTQQYRYYLAVKGTNGLTGNLVNNSQLQVSEF